MPNHFHLIINANDTSCITRKAFGNNYVQELSYQIGKLIGSYSQAINKQNNSSGSLFQQRTKAKHLTSPDNRKYGDYLINVMHYCHQNAWKAGLVKKIEDWPYSSFPDYAGFRNGQLCNKSLLMHLTGYDLMNFYNDSYGIIEGDDFL